MSSFDKDKNFFNFLTKLLFALGVCITVFSTAIDIFYQWQSGLPFDTIQAILVFIFAAIIGGTISTVAVIGDGKGL